MTSGAAYCRVKQAVRIRQLSSLGLRQAKPKSTTFSSVSSVSLVKSKFWNVKEYVLKRFDKIRLVFLYLGLEVAMYHAFGVYEVYNRHEFLDQFGRFGLGEPLLPPYPLK